MPAIGILSHSRIADDPRVRRQGDSFVAAGWDVVGVGLPGGLSEPPRWLVGPKGGMPPEREWPQFFSYLPEKLRLQFRRAWLLRDYLGARVSVEAGQRFYWSSPQVRYLYELAKEYAVDIWLANDWSTLPLAARLATQYAVRYGYDSHEFAVEEYAEQLKWRLLQRPVISIIERDLIGGAAVISTVSPSIAEQLARRYNLFEPPLVVRNAPRYVSPERQPVNGSIRVLYHGGIARGRGLEAIIDSVPAWRSEFDLTIRGPGQAHYLASLEKRIDEVGQRHRVRLVPPVPMTELVKEASAFDVGIHALPGHSRENLYALPNKFFEYAMAGLALCVNDLPEMATLLRRYDMGVLMKGVSPTHIADAINQLDRVAITRYRSNALAAARELCWENEVGRLIESYERVAARRGSGRL